MCTPQWAQIKIGPLLRGERDLRLYSSEFRRSHGEVGRLSGLARRLFARGLPEPKLSIRREDLSDRGVYIFAGLADYFRRLDAEGEWLRRNC